MLRVALVLSATAAALAAESACDASAVTALKACGAYELPLSVGECRNPPLRAGRLAHAKGVWDVCGEQRLSDAAMSDARIALSVLGQAYVSESSLSAASLRAGNKLLCGADASLARLEWAPFPDGSLLRLEVAAAGGDASVRAPLTLEVSGSGSVCVRREATAEAEAEAAAAAEAARPCAAGCTLGSVGDGSCDDACDVEACDFDGGDCAMTNEEANRLSKRDVFYYQVPTPAPLEANTVVVSLYSVPSPVPAPGAVPAGGRKRYAGGHGGHGGHGGDAYHVVPPPRPVQAPWPIEGAAISVYTDGGETLVTSGYSSADGTFTFLAPEEGDIFIVASLEGARSQDGECLWQSLRSLSTEPLAFGGDNDFYVTETGYVKAEHIKPQEVVVTARTIEFSLPSDGTLEDNIALFAHALNLPSLCHKVDDYHDNPDAYAPPFARHAGSHQYHSKRSQL